MPAGRPSSFRQETADIICERLAGGESIRTICLDEDMPAQRAIYRWLEVNEKFRQQYALARERQAECLFDDILEIADDGRNDWMETRGEDDAGWRANGEHIQRSRLRIDTRKWMAGKLAPKKYGDRQAVELTGKDGGAIETKDVTMDEAARRVAFLLASAVQKG